MVRTRRRLTGAICLVIALSWAACSEKKEEPAKEPAAETEQPAEEAKPKRAEGQVELTQGEMLAASCYACHGTDGKSAGGIPSLDGLEPAGIETTLKEFREGSKESTVMSRHAKGYSDEQIKLIAQAFAGK